MKIRSVGEELFHAERRKGRQRDGQAERRTDMTKLTAALHKFVKSA